MALDNKKPEIIERYRDISSQVESVSKYHLEFMKLKPFTYGLNALSRIVLSSQFDKILQDNKRTVISNQDYKSALTKALNENRPDILTEAIMKHRVLISQVEEIKRGLEQQKQMGMAL